jgi:DNA-binding NarL/FixJ family response regulator
MLRYGLRRLLEDASDFAVVGEAGDANEALKLVLRNRPDMVLLDIGMPGMPPLQAGRLIKEHCPGTRVVYLNLREGRSYSPLAETPGTASWVLKDAPPAMLLRALREAHGGGARVGSGIDSQLQEEANLRPAGSNASTRLPLRKGALTLREREVMKLLAEGYTVKGAAAALGIGVKTVEAHKTNLMRKLDIHNKAQLVTVAIQKKILPLPSALQ